MLGLRPLRLAALASLLLTACDPEALESHDELDLRTLSDRHACGDLTLIAADAEGHEGLFVQVDDGLVDAALESGELRTTYAIGDERIELRWVQGQNVYAGHCGLDNGEAWQVDMVEQAIAGEVDLVLVRAGDALRLDVELREIWLSPLAGDGMTSAKGQARELDDLALDGLVWMAQ